VEVYQVLLVDDHPMLRKGVRELLELEDDLNVIGEASSGEDGLGLARELNPDLILLDLGMKGMDGLDCLPLLKNDENIKSKVVVYTVSDEAVTLPWR